MVGASVETLKKALGEAENEWHELRSSLAAHQLSRVRKVREVKKTIARIKTILHQKTKV